MKKFTKEQAFEYALELAKINLESSKEWVSPGDVNYFLESVSSFLTEENISDSE